MSGYDGDDLQEGFRESDLAEILELEMEGFAQLPDSNDEDEDSEEAAQGETYYDLPDRFQETDLTEINELEMEGFAQISDFDQEEETQEIATLDMSDVDYDLPEEGLPEINVPYDLNLEIEGFAQLPDSDYEDNDQETGAQNGTEAMGENPNPQGGAQMETEAVGEMPYLYYDDELGTWCQYYVGSQVVTYRTLRPRTHVAVYAPLLQFRDGLLDLSSWASTDDEEEAETDIADDENPADDEDLADDDELDIDMADDEIIEVTGPGYTQSDRVFSSSSSEEDESEQYVTRSNLF